MSNVVFDVEIGEIQNWLYSPIEYKGKIYLYEDWYCSLNKLVLILDLSSNKIVEIFNDSGYFTVVEHLKGKYDFEYIELIDSL